LVRIIPAAQAEIEKAAPGLSAQAARVIAQQDALAAIESVKSRLDVKRYPERLATKGGATQ
jgi:hypothetical protein